MKESALKLLESLAAKFNTTTDLLWQVLVTQAHVEAWLALLFLAGWAALLCVTIISMRWWVGKTFDPNDEMDGVLETVVIVFLSVFTVALLCWCVPGWLSTALTGFMNPEYWALQQVLSTLK